MDDLIGLTLGRYRIVQHLGTGGMAAVYLARSAEQEQPVALKLLPKEFAERPEFVARFEREAATLMDLQHPNILWVTDYGKAAGYLYMVMPFLRGGTLAHRMEQTARLTYGEAVRAIVQVGNALDYAHRNNLVHRDVKPSNILLNGRGDYLLADFGIVKMYEATAYTDTGTLLGTPTYMSPEQGQGETQLDGRSDIYSLGVVLFELLTGQVPFTATTPIGVVMQHVTKPLPTLRTLNVALPEALIAVLHKALAKDPAERYQTAGEFVRVVQKLEYSWSNTFRIALIPPAVRPVANSVTPVASRVQTVPLPAELDDCAPASHQSPRPITPLPSAPVKLAAPAKLAALARPAAPPTVPHLATHPPANLPVWLYWVGIVLVGVVALGLLVPLLGVMLAGPPPAPTFTPTVTFTPPPTLAPTVTATGQLFVAGTQVGSVVAGALMTVPNPGELYMLELPGVAGAAAGHWYLFPGSVGQLQTVQGAQVEVALLDNRSEAFFNTGSLTFTTHLNLEASPLLVSGTGCFALRLVAEARTAELLCFAGGCQYAFDAEPLVQLPPGMRVKIDLANATAAQTAPQAAPLKNADRNRYADLLNSSVMGAQDSVACGLTVAEPVVPPGPTWTPPP